MGKTKGKRKKVMAAVMTAAVAIIVMRHPVQVRAAGEFDPVFYAAAYADVVALLGTDAEALYNHYQNFGQKEGRFPYAGAAAGKW